jgi:hypothetical protein
MANDGIARPMFTTETATMPPRRTCPSTTAGGMAITAAMATATNESCTCAQVSAGNPRLPDQAALLDR